MKENVKKGDKFEYKEQIKGLRIAEKAKEISQEIPGGAVHYERRKWLFIPKIT